MDTAHRFALIADLHLSDNPHTAAAHALDWAVGWVNRHRPDFLAAGGDMTTFGTAGSTSHLLKALERVEIPVFFTPGNAELRTPDALPLLKDLIAPDRRYAVQGDLLVLLPDTSTGTLPVQERAWMDRVVAEHSAIGRRVVITHYPLDKMERESREWLARRLSQHRVELLAAGHSHYFRALRIGGCLEVTVRGLDPDKAIGDMPGISLFECAGQGAWSERFVSWSPPIELLPADLPDDISPVGWSIHGDPVDAAAETLELGLSCLELRPRDLDFSRMALSDALRRLRDRGPLFLSYHLPNLTWNAEGARIEGEDAMLANLKCALDAGVDSLTVHVPRARSREMERVEGGHPRPTEAYRAFVDMYARLFREPARSGVRIAIENLHNPRGTPVDSPDLLFATRIDEYLRWIDAVAGSMADIPNAAVGAHLDLGHARNNGGDLDNLQPLGDWYARLGRRILGYHIHQVGAHPETGRTANHLEITGFFSRRVSYAGFLWAWSTRQITRGPLFVEVRGDEARRNTVLRFKRLFENAHRIKEAADLPDRASAS